MAIFYLKLALKASYRRSGWLKVTPLKAYLLYTYMMSAGLRVYELWRPQLKPQMNSL